MYAAPGRPVNQKKAVQSKGSYFKEKKYSERYQKELSTSAFLRIQLRDILSPRLTPQNIGKARKKSKVPIASPYQARYISKSNLLSIGKFLDNQKHQRYAKPEVFIPSYNFEDHLSSSSSSSSFRLPKIK